MKKFISSILLVMFMMINAYAEDNKIDEGKSNWFAFGMLEAAAVANSYAALKSPGGYAASWIILFPLAVTYEKKEFTWKEWALVSILPAYNLYLDKELTRGTITRKDIFKRNMIAWNVLGAAAYFLLDNEESKLEKTSHVSLGVAPLEDGMQVSMQYQF